MLDELLTNRWLVLVLVWAVLSTLSKGVYAQDTITIASPDSTTIVTDTITFDTIASGSSTMGIEARVDYKSIDSMVFHIKNQKAYLYTDAELDYQEINLKAAFVEIDFSTSLLYATYVLDSLDKKVGRPVFTNEGQSFTSKELHYNFDNKKGLIKGVITQEGDGYIHGAIIKKMDNDVINVASGKYTTCNLEHPHFEMRFKKAKIIPDNKIVTGPAYVVVEDVPLPLGVPFGMFPIFKGRTSGIIFPSWGESANRGFFLEGGGYYWGISDYIDLTVVGDIYSRGSWAIKPTLSYKKRYKFGGNFNFSWGTNRVSYEGTPEYHKDKNFAIRWNHTQDPKARPNSSFSASVNIVGGSYNRYNPTSVNDYLSNTFQSSISYQKSWAGKYHLSAALNHTQSTSEHTIDLTLPRVAFNINRFYPFRRKKQVGGLKWYENINVNYQMNAENRISTLDSLLFQEDMASLMRNGVKQSIPVSSTIKLLKYFNMTNGISYTQRWYSQKHEKHWVTEPGNEGVDTTFIKTDTTNGFYMLHDFSLSSSVNTRLYGMLAFRKSPLRAVRHVMTPSVAFTYRPDFAGEAFNYYGYVYKDTTKTDSIRYSYFQHGIYGTPSAGKSGNVSFNLNNNLEIKVRSKKDTITGLKKIVLLESFNISTSYDFAKDSLRWAPITMTGRTTIIKNMTIQFVGRWDLYAIDDSTGRRIDQFYWEKEKKLLRFMNNTWSTSFSYTFAPKKKKNKNLKNSKFGTKEELDEIIQNRDRFIDWDNPWRVSISYTFKYDNTYNRFINAKEHEIIQTLSFRGDVNITPKWKIGFNSGYDFEDGEFSYTSLNLYRDLHCWEMRFNWIPTGFQKSWNFAINAKSPLLQDLKLEKKKDFRDYF